MVAARVPIAFANAKDLLDKARRDAAALNDAVRPDEVFNLFVSAHAISDWVRNDSDVNGKMKIEITSGIMATADSGRVGLCT